MLEPTSLDAWLNESEGLLRLHAGSEGARGLLRLHAGSPHDYEGYP